MKNLGIKIVKILCTLVFIGSIAINMRIPEYKDAINSYYCDYKVLSLTTKIETVNEIGIPVIINGGSWLFKTIEDPLIMMSESGVELATAGDDYNIFTQNDHVISVNSDLMYVMTGDVKLFGDKYIITDIDGTKIGTIDFNIFGTNGVLYDTNGTIMAQYDSAFLRKDYIVSIFEGNTLDATAIQMMFASYASDRSGDMNAN